MPENNLVSAKKTIKIKGLSMRTDMAAEQLITNPEGIYSESENIMYGMKRTDIEIETIEASKRLNRPEGKYITIDAERLIEKDMDVKNYVSKQIADALSRLLPSVKRQNTLVVGLGNRSMTSDALGPKVVERLLITRHIKEKPKPRGIKMGSLAAINTGVLGITGIETYDIIRGVTENIRPACVIVVDSLASSRTERISTSFQLTDTGIVPGSGISNHRRAINSQTLGLPVVAIGVPLVVYASTLTLDLLNSCYENSPDLRPDSERLNRLTSRVLTDALGELVVTPKDIDVLVRDCAHVVANGINLAVHSGLTIDEINNLNSLT